MNDILHAVGPSCNGATEGEARRDAALAQLRSHRAAIIRDLTRAAVTLAIQGEFTADDVRAVVPIPLDIKPVVVGAAVRTAAEAGIIAQTGERRRSRRPEAHARDLPVWQLRDAAAAHAWLVAHPPLPTDPQ